MVFDAERMLLNVADTAKGFGNIRWRRFA